MRRINDDDEGDTNITGDEARWRRELKAEFLRRRHQQQQQNESGSRLLLPLVAVPFDEEEIVEMAEVLLSGRLTMGTIVENAERRFAEAVGARFAVMVNSGSSANLLAVAAMTNKRRSKRCVAGDHVLVPAVCWSTSVHPIIQMGLHPVFVDVDPLTFNVTTEMLEAKMTPSVRAVMAVHVLGNSIPIVDLLAFVDKYDLILIEDTCEALGTTVTCDSDHKSSATTMKSGSDQDQTKISSPMRIWTAAKGHDETKPDHNTLKMLGTFGSFGTFSFFFSHHVTSGEGGMVVCRTEEDYNLLRSLRAHGWTRNLTNRKDIEAKYPSIDPRFLFVNLGFNLRPMEIQGAMLRVQLTKLETFNAYRRRNMSKVVQRLEKDPRYRRTMRLMADRSCLVRYRSASPSAIRPSTSRLSRIPRR